jgi:beta-phosphoglucomutase-like phosphatase (HAD superfamily)
MIRHLLFDNDGTLVDTEIIAVRAFLELLRAYDFEMHETEFSRRYTGLLEKDILAHLHQEYGVAVAPNFRETLHQKHQEGFEKHLKPISGMPHIFKNVKVPKSMVSNAQARHVDYCLRRMDIFASLDGQIFSAEHVTNPKPAPDVYLHALTTLQHTPQEVLAVEDSIAGVKSAVAAGIRVVGFLGAAHSYPDHRAQLERAGAHYIAQNAEELAVLLEEKGVL